MIESVYDNSAAQRFLNSLLGSLYREALYFAEIEVASELKTAFITSIASFERLLGSKKNHPSIVRFAYQLEGDAKMFTEMAISRLIFVGNTDGKPGSHVEALYAFREMR